MGYMPAQPPTAVTPLSTIKKKKERDEVGALLTQVVELKREDKRIKSILESDKKTGTVGLAEQAAIVMQSYGIKKTEVAGFYVRVLNGSNTSLSSDRVRNAMMKRGVDPQIILDVLEEAQKVSTYTTVVVEEIKIMEQGALTGAEYKS